MKKITLFAMALFVAGATTAQEFNWTSKDGTVKLNSIQVTGNESVINDEDMTAPTYWYDTYALKWKNDYPAYNQNFTFAVEANDKDTKAFCDYTIAGANVTPTIGIHIWDQPSENILTGDFLLERINGYVYGVEMNASALKDSEGRSFNPGETPFYYLPELWYMPTIAFIGDEAAAGEEEAWWKATGGVKDLIFRPAMPFADVMPPMDAEWAQKVKSTLTSGINQPQNIQCGTYNGYQWVDLDLPSGVKWATSNVGAKNPWEYGDYFAWGERVPYGKEYPANSHNYTYNAEERDIDSYVKFDFNWATYMYCRVVNEYPNFFKYTGDDENVLYPADDAATMNMGEDWRMPTLAEQSELVDNCYWEWTDNYNGKGVKGFIIYRVKDASDKGAVKYKGGSTTTVGSYSLSDTHIFLPAAGYRQNMYVFDIDNSGVGYGGSYWASSLSTVGSYAAGNLHFVALEISEDVVEYRCNGLPVRAVYNESYTISTGSNNASWGMVNGGGDYGNGKIATLLAIPTTGNHFVQWSDGNTDNPRYMKVTGNKELTGIFAEGEAEEPHGETITIEGVSVTPFETKAEFVWTETSGVSSYTLTIWADEAHTKKVCTLLFDSNGKLKNIDFAQSVHLQGFEGFSFTVTGLKKGSQYAYTLESKDSEGDIVETKQGVFSTMGVNSINNITAAGINIYTEGNAIVVENATDAITVSDALGRIVGSDDARTTPAEKRKFTVPSSGVYVVKIGNSAASVLVR